jgi:UDP-2,3-diacylglucosamine hydrolase
MTEARSSVIGEGPLAIICGGGSLPFTVADAARKAGREVVLFALRGSADPDRVAAYPHHWASYGQFGRFCRLARDEGCRDVVFIGTVVRPAIWRVRPDLGTIRLVPRIIRMFRGGDGHLLSGVAEVFEEHGFRLIGAHEIAPEILMPEGALGGLAPSEGDRADIARGLALLRATGRFDIGQAVVVADGHVLAIEAAEGTDHMLARVADMRRIGRIGSPRGRGVLVKAPKAGQDQRIDLPSIGPQTIVNVAQAGLAGLALVAGAAIIAEPQRIAAAAQREQLFVIGVRDDGPAA